MKSGFYCVIASAKLQSQLVWMCIHVYLNNATGGSAARCIQSDLLLSGFWATALMRLHIDQSVSWSVFHRLLSGYKGSGLFYVHDVSTWRRVGMKPELHVMIPKCIGETYFSCIHPNLKNLLLGLEVDWVVLLLTQETCALWFCLFTKVDKSICRFSFCGQNQTQQMILCFADRQLNYVL